MPGRGPTNNGDFKTGQSESSLFTSEVNPESSRAAGGTLSAAPKRRDNPADTHMFPDGYRLTGAGLHTLGSTRKRAYHGTLTKWTASAPIKSARARALRRMAGALLCGESQCCRRIYYCRRRQRMD